MLEFRGTNVRRRCRGWGFAVALFGLVATLRGAEIDPMSVRTAADLKPFLTDYCLGCHNREKHRGDVDFEPFVKNAGADLAEAREFWEKTQDVLERREMPPDNKPQPAESLRQRVVQALETEFERLDASAPPRPGRVTIRRLNRNEYRNTIRDLLAVDYDAHAAFPHDESGYGFDNIGDVLSLPPMLLEKYLAAAEAIAQLVIVTEDPAQRRVRRLPAKAFTTQADAVSTVEEEVWGFYREGEIVTEQEISQAGEYQVRLRTYGEQAGPELPKLAFRLDGAEVRVHAVRALADRPETLDVPVTLSAGKHRFAVAYLNNFNKDGDRNLYLSSFELVGPLGGPPEEYPEPHRRLLPRRPAAGEELAYAAEVLRGLATRAYRRPVTDDEVKRLVRLVEMSLKDGARFEAGMQLALQAVLVSPHFLYRWELDPEPAAGVAARDLTDFEIAARLSYFLWSSMPDEALFEAARRGELRRRETLDAQVRRMLRDPKSLALVQNFGGQWLQVRNLEAVEPDATIFPGWGRELREAMRQETELFLQAVLQEDRSIKELLDADFTFANERLARHYGIAGVEGAEFRRVKLPPDSGRGGVLTMGSVLTVTSVPTRTAPVLRGKWILEQILGTPPPPPPPNVPPIEEGTAAAKSATVRQRLELHRSKPDCMGCHQKMDPLGFALENFDAVGAWRDRDAGLPVDTSAELPGGRKFTGVGGLKEILKHSDDFPRALTAKLLTYALGRGLEGYDRRTVKAIAEELAKNDFKFSSLVLGVVHSDPFLKRQFATTSTKHEQHARAD